MKKLTKPKMEDYGYIESNIFDAQSGWCIEGGEEAYYEALGAFDKQEYDIAKEKYFESLNKLKDYANNCSNEHQQFVDKMNDLQNQSKETQPTFKIDFFNKDGFLSINIDGMLLADTSQFHPSNNEIKKVRCGFIRKAGCYMSFVSEMLRNDLIMQNELPNEVINAIVLEYEKQFFNELYEIGDAIYERQLEHGS